ncbi:hypothetical protein MRX96_044022 [Rhipicephalus microplus]
MHEVHSRTTAMRNASLPAVLARGSRFLYVVFRGSSLTPSQKRRRRKRAGLAGPREARRIRHGGGAGSRWELRRLFYPPYVCTCALAHFVSWPRLFSTYERFSPGLIRPYTHTHAPHAAAITFGIAFAAPRAHMERPGSRAYADCIYRRTPYGAEVVHAGTFKLGTRAPFMSRARIFRRPCSCVQCAC